MAAFNLTAELNLRGPSNLNQVISNIRRQLSTVSLNLNINPSTSRGIQSITAEVRNLSVALRDAQTNAVALATALRGLGASIGNINASAANLRGNLSGAVSSATTTGTAIKAASSEMSEFGKQSALAIRRFAAFSVATGSVYALTRAITSAYGEFINFNKEFTRLQQVTDTNAAGLKSLANEITRLSTSLGVGSQELLNVSVTLAQAGLSAGETKTALEALAKSALAPSFDSLNDTVEGSIALMRQFSISAADLEGALGSINAVAAKFAVEAGDIIAAIQRTGGVFANASKGVSEGKDALNEFLAVFTSVRATTRESAETIATGLRTIFTRIQRASTIEALKQYGIALTDLEGKFVGPYEAVRRLSQGLKALDPRDLRFSQIVEELGGFRQIGKVIPLIQQFQVAQKALGVAQRGSTSLTADAAIAQEALSVRITKVREQFIGLIRDIGQSKGFQTFVDVSLKLASALISVADAAKNVLPAIAAITAIRGVGALGQFFSGFAGGIKRRASGGPIRKYAGGGFTNSVDVALMPGETVLSPQFASSVGTAKLRRINQADKLGKRQKFSRGGYAQVPGKGRTDSYYTSLPVGSFVIRTDATSFLGGPEGVARAAKGKNKFGIGGKTHFSHLDAGPNVIDTKGRKRRYLGKGLSGVGIMMPAEWNLGWAQTGGDFGVSGQSIIDYINNTSNEQLFARQIGRKIGGTKHSGKTGSFRGGRKNPLYETFVDSLDKIKNEIIKSIDPKFTYSKNTDLYPLGRAMLQASGKASRELLRVRTIQTPEGRYEDISNEDMRKLFFGTNKDRDPQGMFSKTFYRKASGGIIQKFGIGGGPSRKGVSLGARSKFKELDESELAKLSTENLIKYAKAQARDVFTTGGAGMAMRSRFIETPANKITPELEPYLTSYMGKKGFWREEIAPFGKAIAKKSSGKQKLSREKALEKQIFKQADEVAARAQQWTSIKPGSAIDNYLSSKLEGPILSDYLSVKKGESLAKPFHETRLRQAVNKALDDFDDFDYSNANIDKLVSGMAAKRFAAGGEIPIMAEKGEYVVDKNSAKNFGYKNLDNLDKYHSGGVVGGFAAGGLPSPRPTNPTAANVVVPQTTLTALQNISEALENLGVSASSSARLLQQGAGITIRAAERALQADVNRARIAGASATDIYNLEQTLAQTREQNAAKARTAFVLGGVGGGQLQDILTRAETERTRLLDQRRASLAGMGLTREEIDTRMADPRAQERIRRRAYETASGAPVPMLHAAGITGGNIEQYINQSMMDRRTLNQMDRQLIQTRQDELRNSAAFTSASAAERRRMLRELHTTTSQEIAERRNIISTLRRDRGLSRGFLSTEMPNISTLGALFGMGQLSENAFGTSRTGRRTRAIERINRFSGAAQQASMGLTFGAGILGESLGKAIGGKEGEGFGAGASAFAATAGVGAMFGPIGLFVGIIGGATAAMKAYTEAIRNATMQEEATKIEGASVKLQKSFQLLEKSTKKTDMVQALKDAGSRMGEIGMAESGRRRVIMQNTLDKQASSQRFENIMAFFTPGGPATIGADLSGASTAMTQSARQTNILQTAPELFERGLAKGLTIKEIKATLGPDQLNQIREQYAVASGGVVADLVARRSEMAARGENTSNITAVINKLSESLFNREVLNELAKREEAQRKTNIASAAATIRINLLGEALKGISAAASKAAASFQETERQMQLAIGGAFGDPTNIIQGPNRQQENILENIQAYSVEQISGIINQIGSQNNFNPALTREAGVAAVNQRILGEELPKILAEVSAQEGQGFNAQSESGILIGKKLEEVLKTKIPDQKQRSDLIKQVLDKIQERLSKEGKSVTVADIAEDFNVLKDIFGSSQEVLKVFNDVLKQTNDTIERLNAGVKEFASRISAATEMRIQAQNIGIEADNQLNQALGRGVSLSDMNAAFDNTIMGLTQRIGVNGQPIRGTGTTDPAVISARIKQKEDEARAIQEQMQKEPIGSDRYKQLDAALKRTTLESLNLSKAHDKLASDSTRASNALSKINELRQVQESRQNSFLDLLKNINNPEAMMDFTNEVGSFAAVMAGQGSVQNFEKAVAGLERQLAVLPQDQAAAVKAQFIQQAMGILQAAGVTNATPQLVESIIQSMGVGTQLSPEMRALVDEFYSYTDVQKDAVNQSADITIAAATKAAEILVDGARQSVETRSAGGQANPVVVQPANPRNAATRAKGGVIYASTGQFVNFQPRGTDTVPAMLTPGEFVVNARATKKNRGLLEAINNNSKAGGYSRGGVVYLEGGSGEYTPKDTTIDADAQELALEIVYATADIDEQIQNATDQQVRDTLIAQRQEIVDGFLPQQQAIDQRRTNETLRRIGQTGELNAADEADLPNTNLPKDEVIRRRIQEGKDFVAEEQRIEEEERSMREWTQRTMQQNNELVQQHRERNLLPGEPLEYENDKQKAYWEGKREKRERFLAGNRFYAEQERKKQEQQQLEHKEAVDWWNSQHPDGRRLPNLEFAVRKYREYQRDKGAAARAEARQQERERILFGAPVKADDEDRASKVRQAAEMTSEEMAKRKEEAKKLERGRQLAFAHGQKPELVVGQSGYASELKYKDPNTGEYTVNPIGYNSMSEQDAEALNFYASRRVSEHNQAVTDRTKQEQAKRDDEYNKEIARLKAKAEEARATHAAIQDDIRESKKRERIATFQATPEDLGAMTEDEKTEYNARLAEETKKQTARAENAAEVDAIIKRRETQRQETVAQGLDTLTEEELSQYPEEIQDSYRASKAAQRAKSAKEKDDRVFNLAKDDPKSYDVSQFEYDDEAKQEAEARGITLQQLAFERNSEKIRQQLDNPEEVERETQRLTDKIRAQIELSKQRIAQLEEARAQRGWLGDLGSLMTGSDPEALEIQRERQTLAVAARLRHEVEKKFNRSAGGIYVHKIGLDQRIDTNMRVAEQLAGLRRSEAKVGTIREESQALQQESISLAQQAVTDTALTVGTLGVGSVATGAVRAVGGTTAKIATRSLVSNAAVQGTTSAAARQAMATGFTSGAARSGVTSAINQSSDTEQQTTGEFAAGVLAPAVVAGSQEALASAAFGVGVSKLAPGAAQMPTGPNLTEKAFKGVGRAAEGAVKGAGAFERKLGRGYVEEWIAANARAANLKHAQEVQRVQRMKARGEAMTASFENAQRAQLIERMRKSGEFNPDMSRGTDLKVMQDALTPAGASGPAVATKPATTTVTRGKPGGPKLTPMQQAVKQADEAAAARGVVDDPAPATGRTRHNIDYEGPITPQDRAAAVKAVKDAQKAQKAAGKKTLPPPDPNRPMTVKDFVDMQRAAAVRKSYVRSGLYTAGAGVGAAGAYQFGYLDPEYWDPGQKRYVKKNPTNKARGGVIYASTGTLVPYQPRGTDTVPAMLTPGEFVINRKAAKQNMGLLKAINNGHNISPKLFNKGGVVPTQYYADGIDNVSKPSGGGGVLSSIGVDTSSLDAAFSNFNSYVSSLSTIIDSFTQGTTELAGLSQAIGSLGNLQLREGAGLMANAGTSVKEASIAFSAEMAKFNSAASALATAIASIPPNITLTVSGSIPVTVTVQLEGGVGTNTDLSQIEQSVINKVGLAINSATQGGINIDTIAATA